MIELSDSEDDDEDDSDSEEDEVDEKKKVTKQTSQKNESSNEQGGEESSSSQKEESLSQTLPTPICGGHVKTVIRKGGNNARTNLKNQLQQKKQLQSTESVAKKFGLSNSQDLVIVLGGMELER